MTTNLGSREMASLRPRWIFLEGGRGGLHGFVMPWVTLISAFIASYLCGSFPSGYLAGRMRGVDLRREGSGNVGATNALRVLGKGWGYGVFVMDALKGFLGVRVTFLIAASMSPGWEIPAGVVGAVGTVLGHNFPVWLGFRGGKGISTSAGVMLALFPIWVFLSGIVAWGLVFSMTRYVSLASLAASLALPVSSAALWVYGRCEGLLVATAGLMCLLAFWRHRPNIARLATGTEKRFERKKKSVPGVEANV